MIFLTFSVFTFVFFVVSLRCKQQIDMKLLYTALLLLITISVYSQHVPDSLRRTFFLTAKGEAGMIINTNDFLDGLNAKGEPLKRFSAYTLGVGWQTSGKREWERIHNLPSFGVSLYTAKLDYDDEIGQPISLFGFYKGTMWRGGAHSLKYNIDLGLAFNWKDFNKNTNPYNITIGSPVTVHLGLAIEYNYIIAQRLIVGVGAGATHFSNGAMRKPNKGLNLVSPYVRLSYLMSRPQSVTLSPDYGRKKGHELFAAFGMGMKRSECDTVAYPQLDHEIQMGAKYMMSSFQLGYLRQYGHKGKFGAGLSVIYDEWLGSSLRPLIDDVEVIKGDVGKRFTLGGFVAHELLIDRLCVHVQLGAYFLTPDGIEQSKPKFFQRAGVKYLLPWNTFVGVNIYAHKLSKADFIEWNVGYRIPWGEKIVERR